MNYRRDIDGLRAIAVLSVILFHIDRSLLPGGFTGVDIFFVISGFLIIGNIAKEIEGGEFSLAEFYRRRIKRIAPALMVVIAVTLAIAHLLLLPEDARLVAKSAIWSLLSLANVYFWLYQDTGYFAPDSAEAPLLHLWSLGVEEQFYLLWPLLLLALYRPRARRAFITGSALFALLSFFAAARLFDAAPAFVYYMLPTRAGELLLGGIVAIAVLDGVPERVRRWQANACAATGIALIATGLVFVTERQPFPGWLAIVPTLGTALVILAGQCGERRLTGLLSLRPLVWVGLISYSAYLWHWPLFAFYRYGYGPIGVVAGPVLLGATLLLAWISYRYVEQPARRSTAPALRIFAAHYVAPAAVLLTVSLIAMYPERAGIALATQGYRRRLAELRRQTLPALGFDDVCQHRRVRPMDVTDPRCVEGAPSQAPPAALLWGDSNAAHYIGMIDTFAHEAGFRFRNIEVDACPPILGDPAPYVAPPRLADCRASLEIIRPLAESFDVIIIAASWTLYNRMSGEFLRAVQQTARALAGSNRTVIIIGRVPVIRGYDRRCREKALRFPLLDCPRSESAMPQEIAAMNGALRRFAESERNIEYFDATAYLCPKGRCSAFRADGEPKYYDSGHLTHAASFDLGVEIVATEGVPPAFAAIARLPP
jgi:peptidoglycan/LPS O-acetylase OafA/YrhL